MGNGVTQDVLEKVARLLGVHKFVATDDDYLYVVDAENVIGECWHKGRLLLAILNRAAEMGQTIELHFYDGLWFCEIYDAAECSPPLELKRPTALEASLLAFAQLEVSP